MPQIISMKRGIVFTILLLNSQWLFAQNEIGPEGHKLFWLILLAGVIAGAFVLTSKPFKKHENKEKHSFFSRSKLLIKLDKDALYYPSNLLLTVKNEGNSDCVLDKPLLVFDNFWIKRKFRLKGQDNYSFYPLYLEKGKTHTLQINLDRFYSHDKKLRKFPKAKVYLTDVQGKKLGSRTVFLRKTLFKF